jgi:signal peptidase II
LLSWIIVIAAAVVVDQVSKILVIKYLKDIVSVELIPGIFRFTYVENRGAAFGMLSDNRWVFMIISTLAIGALIVYLWKFRPDSRLACLALSMIAGGGIGNMIDRVALGYVVDFIDFCAFPNLWMWVFNIADAFVCVGAGLLILWLIISMAQESREQKIKRMVSLYEDEPQEEQKD